VSKRFKYAFGRGSIAFRGCIGRRLQQWLNVFYGLRRSIAQLVDKGCDFFPAKASTFNNAANRDSRSAQPLFCFTRR
jgi:hypothetical protein